MFDFMHGIMQAWREIAYVAEFTGLSVGILLFLGFVAYSDPGLRKAAIRLGLLVFAGYFILMYGMHLGAGAVRTEWKAANIEAAAAAKARDQTINKDVSAEYGPAIANRDKTIAALNKKVAEYEKSAHGPPCPLGAGPLRLRTNQ